MMLGAVGSLVTIVDYRGRPQAPAPPPPSPLVILSPGPGEAVFGADVDPMILAGRRATWWARTCRSCPSVGPAVQHMGHPTIDSRREPVPTARFAQAGGRPGPDPMLAPVGLFPPDHVAGAGAVSAVPPRYAVRSVRRRGGASSGWRTSATWAPDADLSWSFRPSLPGSSAEVRVRTRLCAPADQPVVGHLQPVSPFISATRGHRALHDLPRPTARRDALCT
jgi:hypothetical protein